MAWISVHWVHALLVPERLCAERVCGERVRRWIWEWRDLQRCVSFGVLRYSCWASIVRLWSVACDDAVQRVQRVQLPDSLGGRAAVPAGRDVQRGRR